MMYRYPKLDIEYLALYCDNDAEGYPKFIGSTGPLVSQFEEYYYLSDVSAPCLASLKGQQARDALTYTLLGCCLKRRFPGSAKLDR